MYLYKLEIKNYRNFNNFDIELNEGLNVFVGSNNSGKTGLLKAIQLINNPGNITVNDFNLNDIKQNFMHKYKKEAPEIHVVYGIKHILNNGDFEDESFLKLYPFINVGEMETIKKETTLKIDEDKTEISDSIEGYGIKAHIKMVFSLNPTEQKNYLNDVSSVSIFDDYLEKLDKYFYKYSWNFYNGHTMDRVDKSIIHNIFHIDFIEAERNNEEVYKETKKEINDFLNNDDNIDRLKELEKNMSSNIRATINEILNRIEKLILNEKNDIGLSDGDVGIYQEIKPKSTISDSYLIRVRDTKNDYILPMSHNGLGYNNLINIYMLLKLVKKTRKSDFNILCLEEPEAHLHPAMQYKLFKYIRSLENSEKLSQQIFVSTHSPNISSVAGLDNIYMIDYLKNGKKIDVIAQSMKDLMKKRIISKDHMGKFLDVTRSDMLFTDKVILVEGIAEKLLIPLFIKRMKRSYENEHISIVEIGGKNFNYFLDLFHKNKVQKNVLVVTDKDFTWNEGVLLKSLNDYKSYTANHFNTLKITYKTANIKVVSQKKYGSTFEDELFMENILNQENAIKLLKIALPESLHAFIDKCGINFYKWGIYQNKIPTLSKNKIESIYKRFLNTMLTKKSNIGVYKKLFFAHLFYSYIKKNKGDTALNTLTDKYLSDNIAVPDYIKEGLEWLLL